MPEQDGVRIESRSGLGNVLVATRAYKPGDIVVFEQPLLHVPHLKPSNQLYRPLQAYFEQHGIPASVVLKLMAYFTAPPADQAKVLQCATPNPTAFADAAVVKQAQLFADTLLKHPPVQEFSEWMSAPPAAAATGDDPPQQQQQQQQQLRCYDLLVKLWLVWVTNGHSFRMGSALFHYGSKLTHTCAAPNTAYRTASGETAAVHGMAADSGTSSTPGQLPAAAAGPAAAAAAAAAGYHVALAAIQPGEILTTNYLGLGHKRLMGTPARQQLLQSKFLFKCTCDRCTKQPDLARGIPCPACSGPFRAPDKLLTEAVALPPWDFTTGGTQAVQHNGGSSSSSTAAGGLGAITEEEEKESIDSESLSPPAATAAAVEYSSSGASVECGYVYCDMPQLLSGAAEPWKCDVCAATFANNTMALWGRYYTRSHATIEGDMESWVMRLDDSIDAAPFVRVPSSLHARVVGILRLLGPRHWASWRLLLLGVELHCGVLEQTVVQYKISPTSPATAAAAAAPAGQQQQQQQDDRLLALQATAENASRWVVSYCMQLWKHLQHVYGEIEAGQVLGYHFTEASAILLQAASTPGLLPAAAAAAEALMDAALNLQQLILPGMRSIMGETYSPLSQLLDGQQQQHKDVPFAAAAAAAPAGDLSSAGTSGSVAVPSSGSSEIGGRPAAGRYVAASVKRYLQQQAAEAARVQAVIEELRQLEASEAADQK